MKNKDEIVYQLTIDDVQTVANLELNRELTLEEIKKLIEPIAEKMPWYDTVANAINDTIVEHIE